MIPEPRVVDSGCNNRSKDDHSFLKSQDFLCGDFFSSRQFRRIVYSFEIIQNLCFSRILKSISPKHVCTPVKFYRFCQKSRNPSRYKPITTREVTLVQIPARLAFPKINFGGQNHRSSLARTRARPHAHAHAVYILI